MSSSFLSTAERERWQRVPATIPQDDLAVYFFLSESLSEKSATERFRRGCRPVSLN